MSVTLVFNGKLTKAENSPLEAVTVLTVVYVSLLSEKFTPHLCLHSHSFKRLFLAWKTYFQAFFWINVPHPNEGGANLLWMTRLMTAIFEFLKKHYTWPCPGWWTMFELLVFKNWLRKLDFVYNWKWSTFAFRIKTYMNCVSAQLFLSAHQILSRNHDKLGPSPFLYSPRSNYLDPWSLYFKNIWTCWKMWTPIQALKFLCHVHTLAVKQSFLLSVLITINHQISSSRHLWVL